MDEAEERALAASLFNQTWAYLDRADRTPDDDVAMVHAAHASRWHWGNVGQAVHRARGEWQVSRVYAVLGRPEPARWHADRCVQLCEEHDLGGFDLAFAHEAVARAAALAGDAIARQAALDAAAALLPGIEDAEDRQLVEADLATVPSAG